METAAARQTNDVTHTATGHRAEQLPNTPLARTTTRAHTHSQPDRARGRTRPRPTTATPVELGSPHLVALLTTSHPRRLDISAPFLCSHEHFSVRTRCLW
ncbi:hypothetical protein BaRGS_00001332 [Batillaria attramentaria]|uniref:Uncharacterized protein n=1 Tax=Batillaria attramentaria TaxID=370345 RepID=A0ABD0M7A6_9CAEN